MACARRWLGAFAVLAAMVWPGVVVRAQPCSPGFLSGVDAPGFSSPTVNALVTAPDGRLFAGGQFLTAAGTTLNRVARWDGAGWRPLGSGCDNEVKALAVMPNGDLVAGGSFTTAGGVAANRVARWNGTAWAPLGSGVDADVHALAAMPNGDVVAAGSFSTAGGAPAVRIARWNGSAWSALGAGLNGQGLALAVMPNGDLVAAGRFTSSGAVTMSRIGRWNGTAWSAMGPGLGDVVFALAVLPNGNVAAAGQFTTDGGGAPFTRIAQWNGQAWRPLWAGIGGTSVNSLAVTPGGDLIAGGRFTNASGIPAANIARWDGTDWFALGDGVTYGSPSTVGCVAALPNGDVVMGGSFGEAGYVRTLYIARWDGARWHPMPDSLNSFVHAFAPGPDGALYVGGEFATAGGRFVNHVGLWDPSAVAPGGEWTALGAGMDSTVWTLRRLASGELFAGGEFTTAGGVPASCAAIWNGQAWRAMGAGLTGAASGGPELAAFASAVMPNGDLVVGGRFTTAGGVTVNHIARWNGTAWAPLSTGVANGIYTAVFSLLPLPNGDLLVGGAFTNAGGVAANNIARWNGTAFSPLGGGVTASQFNTRVLAMARVRPEQADSPIVVGGDFLSAGGAPVSNVALWSGGAWSALGAGLGPNNAEVDDFEVLPGGEILAAGGFVTSGATRVNRLARWDGAAWVPLGDGLNAIAQELELLPSGELAVGGRFTTAGGQSSAYVARWSFDGVPTIAEQPASAAAACGENLVLDVRPTPGYGAVSYEWRRGGTAVDLQDPRMSVVSTDLGSVLTVAPVRAEDAGSYDCVVSVACGGVGSRAAEVTVTGSCCPADFNGDGFLDFFDYDDYVNCFETGACPPGKTADFNGDGFADFFDYDDFVAAFQAGC